MAINPSTFADKGFDNFEVWRMILVVSISISFSEVAAKLIKIFFSQKTEARPGYQKRLGTLPLFFSSVSSFWSDATSISDAILLTGWQKLCEGMKGLRRKVWTRTKILSPNIRYIIAIL